MIEQLLPVHDMFKALYEEKILHGKQLLKKSDIVIISLARNVENVIHKNLNQILTFFNEHAKSVNYVIFENDSTDNTVKIITDYTKIFKNQIHLISENLDREHFGPVKDAQRIIALSEYRNKAQMYAKQFKSDFVVVLDIDFTYINLNGILNSFGWLHDNNNIGGIAGNSFEFKPGIYKEDPEKYTLWNYDSWAFRHNWWLDLQNNPPAPQNAIDPMFWFGCWIPPTGSPPITVNSAFGGCGIYRSQFYFEAQYDNKDCEHVCLHFALYKNSNFNLVLNPSQQMVFKL